MKNEFLNFTSFEDLNAYAPGIFPEILQNEFQEAFQDEFQKLEERFLRDRKLLLLSLISGAMYYTIVIGLEPITWNEISLVDGISGIGIVGYPVSWILTIYEMIDSKLKMKIIQKTIELFENESSLNKKLAQDALVQLAMTYERQNSNNTKQTLKGQYENLKQIIETMKQEQQSDCGMRYGEAVTFSKKIK